MDSFGFAFGTFGIVFILIFALSSLLFIGLFAFILIKNFTQKQKNDASPRIAVDAEVVAKRTYVQGDHAYTTYYATFQVDSGDRMELMVPYNQFGYLIEGDRGRLTFQGTRFLQFERTV